MPSSLVPSPDSASSPRSRGANVSPARRWAAGALGAVLMCGCAPKIIRNPEAVATAEEARAHLAKISKRKVQLWVVLHVRANKTKKADGTVDEKRLTDGALADADAAVKGGADLMILINSRCEMPLYERVIAAVREKYPDFPMGISALAYGPDNLSEGYRLAEKFKAQMVWLETVPKERIEYEDDDGSYKAAEVITPDAATEEHRNYPAAFLTGGVHMKYTRPLDGYSFDEAMKRALGLVDGINITGPATGVLADVKRVRRARELAGAFPLGLASGVSEENIESVLPYIDYAIVGTSLKKPEDPLRTSEARVRALRQKMDELGGG